MPAEMNGPVYVDAPAVAVFWQPGSDARGRQELDGHALAGPDVFACPRRHCDGKNHIIVVSFPPSLKRLVSADGDLYTKRHQLLLQNLRVFEPAVDRQPADCNSTCNVDTNSFLGTFQASPSPPIWCPAVI